MPTFRYSLFILSVREDNYKKIKRIKANNCFENAAILQGFFFFFDVSSGSHLAGHEKIAPSTINPAPSSSRQGLSSDSGCQQVYHHNNRIGAVH
jgi:hypothetical protein